MALDQGTKHEIGVNEFKTFIFQGKARFTLWNVKTGTHIMFDIWARKVKRGEPEETRYFNVEVKALGDQVFGKLHIGEIDRVTGNFYPKNVSLRDHVGSITIKWLINHWKDLDKFFDTTLKAYHHNICSKCSMPLTVPESIQDGIGPICVVTRMKKTLKLLEELGMYFDPKVDWKIPANYDSALVKGIETWPDNLDKFFVPSRVRAKDDFTSFLYRMDDLGLW